MSIAVLVISPPARLATGALVLALAIAFAAGRRLAVVLLVLFLATIAAGARIDPTDISHERDPTHRR